MLLLFFATSDVVAFRHRRIPLIAGNVYKLSLRVRSDTLQTFNLLMTDSSIANVSLNALPSIKTADKWIALAYEFTAVATDTDSILWVKPATVVQNFYVDRVKLFNMTKERKEYRVMRIVGAIMGGSFVQTLTIREKTAAETA